MDFSYSSSASFYLALSIMLFDLEGSCPAASSLSQLFLSIFSRAMIGAGRVQARICTDIEEDGKASGSCDLKESARFRKEQVKL